MRYNIGRYFFAGLHTFFQVTGCLRFDEMTRTLVNRLPEKSSSEQAWDRHDSNPRLQTGSLPFVRSVQADVQYDALDPARLDRER